MLPKKLKRKPDPESNENGIIPEDLIPVDESKPAIEKQDTDFEYVESSAYNIDCLLKDFFDRQNVIEADYTASLYKYDNSAGVRKSLMWQFTNEIAIEHEVGLRWKGGKYEYIINAVDSNGKRLPPISKKFRVDSSYNNIQKDSATTAIAVTGSNSNPDAFLSIIERVFAMITPILASNQANNSMNPELMISMYKGLNETMRQNALDNSQLVNDVMREKLNLAETVEDESEVTGIQGMINSVMPVIQEFLPIIFNGKGKVNRPIINTVKKNKLFKQLSSNVKAQRMLYDQMCKNVSIGEDKAKELFRGAGLISKG
jgi:hypothetical protein